MAVKYEARKSGSFNPFGILAALSSVVPGAQVATPWLSAWYSSCVAPNGKIYCMPNASQDIFCIDPTTNTTNTFTPTGMTSYLTNVSGPGGDTPGFLINSCCVGADGKIYGFSKRVYPEVSYIFRIDPVLETMSLAASVPFGLSWGPGVLAPNGKIYHLPSSLLPNGVQKNLESQSELDKVLCFDPVTNAITSFGGTFLQGVPIVRAWTCGALAPNGKIYGFIENWQEHLLCIDPSDNTLSLVHLKGVQSNLGSTTVSPINIASVCLAGDGCFYCFSPVGIPAPYIVKISGVGEMTEEKLFLLDPALNTHNPSTCLTL